MGGWWCGAQAAIEIKPILGSEAKASLSGMKQSYLALLVVLAGVQVARSDSNECMPAGHASSVTTKHHHPPKPYTSWAAEHLLSATTIANAIDCSKLVPQNRGKYWVSAKLEPGGSLSSLVK